MAEANEYGEGRGGSALRGIFEWVAVFAVAMALMFGIRAFVAEPFTVPTGSMEPTILIGDNVIAQKVTLEVGQQVSAGDIVVFRNPVATSEHDILVKRVIAVGGQTVDLRDGVVYVDGRATDEPYTHGSTYPLDTQADGVEVSFPYTVPEGSVWLMGDNRENSADSRYFGAVPVENLIGVAFFRYWPLDRVGTL